jgi:hypothetical protein
MTITADELNVDSGSSGVIRPQPQPGKDVRIVEWVAEVPQHRRVSPFDVVIAEIRKLADPNRIAKIEWEEKPISPNKVNQLRKRYPDCEFKQITVPGGRETYVSYKGDSTSA